MVVHGPFSQLVSLDGLSVSGTLSDENLLVIENAGIAISDGIIMDIGDFDQLRKKFPHADVDDTGRGMTVIPGFIDAHTHLVWAEDRVMDYAMRVAGSTYLEIAESGGGIWSSVLKTREADEKTLIEKTIRRAERHLSDGVTTIEVKSGYGLSVDSELKLLRAVRQANSNTAADLIPTCLAAHMKPRDFQGTDREYLNMIASELLPLLKEQSLSDRVDIFIEKTAFNEADSLEYLNRAKSMGFDITVHADQFTTGGSTVGIAAGAISVDHLEASGENEIHAICNSNVVAVALPGASMGLGMPYTPARKILDQGGKLAIASDWNPGSAPMGDLVMQASVLGTFEKLTLAETLAGITFRAAAALGLADRGRLAVNEHADFQAYETNDFRSVFYHQGRLKPSLVWKSGQIVHRRG